MVVKSLDPVAQGIDGLFGPMPLECQCDGGLGAMKQDDPAKLLVRGDVVFLVARAGGRNPSRRACGRRLEWLYRAVAGPARRCGDGKTG